MTDSDALVRRLVDESDIRALIFSFAHALDAKDWDAYGATFTDDAEFEILGQRRTGREAITAGPARDLARFDRLQHLVTNQVVNVVSDEATGQWYLFGIHVPDAQAPGRHADVGGRYRFTCRRTTGGWRFSEVVLAMVWQGGMDFEIEDQPEVPA